MLPGAKIIRRGIRVHISLTVATFVDQPGMVLFKVEPVLFDQPVLDSVKSSQHPKQF
jgi:hypothetical protein